MSLAPSEHMVRPQKSVLARNRRPFDFSFIGEAIDSDAKSLEFASFVISKFFSLTESNVLTLEFVMRILKLKEVLHKTSLGKTTLYMLIKYSAFPKPVPLGLRAVGWLDSEVDTWIQSRIMARDQTIN